MKTYYGIPLLEDEEVGGAIVKVRGPKGKGQLLVHHVRHSPDGFNWGYDGSGPSELARCILLDAFGTSICPETPCTCENSWVDSLYEQYKEEVISKLNKKSIWHIRQDEVMDWVFDATAHERIEMPASEPV